MARGKVYTTAPLLYNDQGDPIPQYLDVSDKTDSPQGSFKPLTNDPQDVRLTGSKVEEVTAIERGVYSETERRYLDIPDGVIGVFVYARIRSVVGNFSTDEGYKLWTFPIIEPTGVPINHTFEDYTSMSWSTSSEGTSTSPSVYLYPTINEARKSGQQISLPTRVDVGRRLRIDLRISGEFQSGEGIDAEVFVRWLK